MAYVNSLCIKMYPSAFRGQITNNNPNDKRAFDPESRVFTEENTTRIARLLSRQRNGSFIINEAGTSASQIAELEFVLGGYYFRIDNDGLNDTGLRNGTWYASIKVAGSEEPHVASNKRLVNLADPQSQNFLDVQIDSAYKFGALQLTNTEPTDSTLTTMLIIKDGKIPTASTLKFRRQDIAGNSAGTQSLDNLLETNQVTTPKVVTKEILATTDQNLVIKNPKKSINIDVGSNNVLDQNFVVSYNNNEKIKVQNANTTISNNTVTINGNGAVIINGTSTNTIKANDNTYISVVNNGNAISTKSDDLLFTANNVKTKAINKHLTYVGNVPESIAQTDNIYGVQAYKHDIKIERAEDNTIYSCAHYYYDSDDDNPTIDLISYYSNTYQSKLQIRDNGIDGESTHNIKFTAPNIYLYGTAHTKTLLPITTGCDIGSSNSRFSSLYLNSSLTAPTIQTYTTGNRTIIDKDNFRSNLPIKLYGSTTFNDNNLKISLTPSSGEIKAVKFVGTSDERLKENVEDFDYTKSILDLPVHTYNFKSDEKKEKQIGCIAQELQQLYPELVSEDESGMLGVQETKLIYLLLEEVKRLDKRVKELESK